MTVQEAIHSASCSTALVRGLSDQIVREMLALEPGVLVPVISPKIHAANHVHLFLQPIPRASLLHVLAARDATLIINSCLRVLPEQLMLWTQYQEGRCGITLAAPPADSPHEIGAAVDVKAPLEWKAVMEAHGWAYLGPRDRPHFQHMSDVRRDLGALGISAFQHLYNQHHPQHAISIDAVFGPITRAALLAAPAEGWK